MCVPNFPPRQVLLNLKKFHNRIHNSIFVVFSVVTSLNFCLCEKLGCKRERERKIILEAKLLEKSFQGFFEQVL